MKSIVKFLPVLIALSIVGQSFAAHTVPCSKKNITSRVKREGPDIVGIGMQMAATAVDVASQGAAVKGEWKVKSGNEK